MKLTCQKRSLLCFSYCSTNLELITRMKISNVERSKKKKKPSPSLWASYQPAKVSATLRHYSHYKAQETTFSKREGGLCICCVIDGWLPSAVKREKRKNLKQKYRECRRLLKQNSFPKFLGTTRAIETKLICDNNLMHGGGDSSFECTSTHRYHKHLRQCNAVKSHFGGKN